MNRFVIEKREQETIYNGDNGTFRRGKYTRYNTADNYYDK